MTFTKMDNVTVKTIKLLDKNIRENLWDLEIDKAFLDLTPKPWSIKGKTDKLNFFKT